METHDRFREKMWGIGEKLEEFRRELPEHKTERIQLRVTPSEKREVQEVTELLGTSESGYLMHLHRRAMRELDRKQGRDPGSKSREGRTPRKRRGGDDGEGLGAIV